MDQVGSTCVLYKSSSQYVLKSKSCSHSLTRSDTYSSREMETDREKKSEGVMTSHGCFYDSSKLSLSQAK
jgi:hypothetical protein